MTADFRHMHFLKSAAGRVDFPPDTGREVAFAGRSNAGKSSALNAVAGVKGLARVSKTPGRTRLVNFFDLDSERRFVDLPGYGYAKVPSAVQAGWASLVQDYFEARDCLAGLVLVTDIRHALTEFDRQMLGWSAPLDLAVLILLSKADKLSRSAALRIQRQVDKELEGRVRVQTFSAVSGEGVQDARQIMAAWLAGGEATPEKKNPGAKGGKHRG